MLIAPLVKAMEEVGRFLPAKNLQHTVQPIPEFKPQEDIKLAEGQGVVHLKVHGPYSFEVVDTYQLDKFLVKRSTAYWDFISNSGSIQSGTSQEASLNSNLTVKLVDPIVLLGSRHGLRTTFRFCTDADHRVMSISKYNGLIGVVR